ncbi:hypothetical protein AYI70_g4553 [Smittium culicis]|uniref:Uncharacterized protein n=1 Tax=Smittium culicis TaxID=133412 RepID=A0A1R1XEW8_9FUNG|nr:hypothetical protein AYI70_g8669 [Smittium culicis]OMJ19715.1 hypothetical protein AYI70_g4553 [Smittium culicis]
MFNVSVLRAAKQISRASARGVASTSAKANSNQDLLKDLYLKELRSTKANAPVKSDVQVKNFTEPKRPSGLADDVQAAEKDLYNKDGVVSN